MLTQTKSPETAGGSPGLENSTQPNHSTTEPPRKWRRVLAAMTHGKTFNRFEAERELSDHCLHTTVASLQARGVVIDRSDETVPEFAGISTHVKRYRLAPESRARAAELLGLAPTEATTTEQAAA